MSTGFNPEDGLWLIASSNAHDEAKALGLRRGGVPMSRYIQKRMPEIYAELKKKTEKKDKTE